MVLSFNKSCELKGCIHVKIPLKCPTILNSEKIDKFCILWSILAKLHPISDSKNEIFHKSFKI